MSCILPNCNNAIGVGFPRDENLKRIWMDILKLNVEPDENAILCCNHFRDTDIIQKTDSNECVLKEGAFPINDLDKDFVNTEIENLPQQCRVCMGSNDLEHNLNDQLNGKFSIAFTLNLCLSPIKFSTKDELPQRICKSCLDELQTAYKLRIKCLESDYEFRKRRHLKNKRKAEDSKRDDDAVPRIRKIRIVQSEKSPEKDTDSDSYVPLKDASEMLKDRNIEVSNLPKCLKIKSTFAFESKKGVFAYEEIKEICDTNYLLVDGYLFAKGLLKYNTQHLHCVLSSCKAKAEHNVLENSVLVKVPHNHKVETGDNLKKQMFVYVLTGRIQRDKTLNIRAIYEEIATKIPEMRTLMPLKNIINEICRSPAATKTPTISHFSQLYDLIETDAFSKVHFTHSNRQFYQEKLSAPDGTKAIMFANLDTISQLSHSSIMYVDASYKIDTKERFKYQLVTVLVWNDESYYPIMYGLISRKSQEIFKRMFAHLKDVMAPSLRPTEIITDYEAQIYYALGETYIDAHIGGAIFYYAQNIYKKLCTLNLSKNLESNSAFRNVYRMLLMLPLLPVNTIEDALGNIEIQAKEADLDASISMGPLFAYVRTQWICSVTPELFCVHKLENRINENVIAPFRKLRDLLLTNKGKSHKDPSTVAHVVEKLKELEAFLARPDKKSFSRDLSSAQKKNVIRAWAYIESHPKINVDVFSAKVLGYVKCLENQLWIWGFYGYSGTEDDALINVSNFSIVSNDDAGEDAETNEEFVGSEVVVEQGHEIVLEGVVDENGGLTLQSNIPQVNESAFLNYVSEVGDEDN